MSNFSYLFLIISITANAQTFGPQQIVSTQGNGPEAVFVADLDGDLLVDVMSANRLDSNLLWYKNLGDGTFGIGQLIANVNQPLDIFAADIDGDEDNDILSLSGPDNTLVWYENLEGLGFGSQLIIAVDAFLTTTIIAADIDGDDDMDVISGTDGTGLIWYENLDGLGNFGTKTIIAPLPACRSVFAGDIDGDLDLDLVAVTSGSENLFWFENLDGQGNFSSQKLVSLTTTFVNSVYCKDLDGDNDLDIITAIPANDIVAWHENLDGLGNFGEEQIISLDADFARDVFAADLDNDNDNDILSASAEDDKVAWYENLDGLGNFGPQQILTTDADSCRSVYAADIDNDGDIDVFSASLLDDKVAWYENLTILNTDSFSILGFKVYPNPTTQVLTIESATPLSKVNIYNILGAKLMEVVQNVNEISTVNLPSGLLLVEIETEKGKVIEKIIKQ